MKQYSSPHARIMASTIRSHQIESLEKQIKLRSHWTSFNVRLESLIDGNEASLNNGRIPPIPLRHRLSLSPSPEKELLALSKRLRALNESGRAIELERLKDAIRLEKIINNMGINELQAQLYAIRKSKKKRL